MKIPQETQEKIREYQLACDMRDASIKHFFGERRALKYGRLAVKLLEEIRYTIHNLYPSLIGVSWHTWNTSVTEIEVFPGKLENHTTDYPNEQ